jgi:hypothetical protein
MISENNQGPRQSYPGIEVIVNDDNGLTGWKHCEALPADGTAWARWRLNSGLCSRSIKSPAGPVLAPPAKDLSVEAKDKCDRQE